MVEVIAHRGASRLERENSVAAFQTAVELGSDGIELDVRRTLEGTLVTHHDAVLGDGRIIVQTRRTELPDFVPTLAEALDACSGSWVNLEIKNHPGEPDFDPADTVAEGVVAELRRRPSGSWLVSSFRWETIERCRELAPDIATGWLVLDVAPDTVERVARHGHTALHPPVDAVTAELVASCHGAGLAVNTWTCNDPARAVELARWGVDGIVTDDPRAVLDALGR